MYGDSHLRGLRISLNITFSAGGQSAPIFACVFGLKPNEMPGDEIVVCKCKGLVAASNVNGSTQEGYIVFIRGKYEPSNNADISIDDKSNDTNDSSVLYIIIVNTWHGLRIFNDCC